MPTAASRLSRPNDLLFTNSARRSVTSLSFHGEGLLQNPRGRLRPLVFRQLLFACEGDFGQLDHAYRDTGLFQQFARHAFLQRLAQLQRSPWYRPFSKQRLAAASNQQRASLVDNYAAYTNQRSFWILPRRCHL